MLRNAAVALAALGLIAAASAPSEWRPLDLEDTLVIETMVRAYSKIFGTLKPVFDGRNNLYARDPLPIGNDKVELEVGK